MISCVSVYQDINPEDVAINQAEFSYLLYDLDNREIVSSYNEDLALMPASILKLFTGYAALETLGYDKRFVTQIYYNGELKNGVLHGDLILRGGGDPSLGYEDLFNIASLIRKQQITTVTGSLVYEDDFLIAMPEINSNQPNEKYNSGLSSLVLRNNSFFLKGGVVAENKFLIPQLDYMKFKIADDISTPEYIKKYSWLIDGKKNYHLPIKDTSFFVANILKQILQYNNIKISTISYHNKQGDRKLLLEYHSNPLINILRYNLNFSHNLTSEILLLQFASAIQCNYDDLGDAAKCLSNWYQEKFPEISWRNLGWDNGSGLSLNTNITTLHILSLLQVLYNKQYGSDMAISLLPVSGLSGTLKHKFLDNSLNIWAKTGNMYFVSGLAGYLFNKERRYIFIILANDKIMRERLDNLDKEYNQKEYEYLIEYAKLWKEKIYDKQQQLIKIWLNN